MFSFGEYDINIQSNCNINEDSYSEIGDTYEPPDGIEYETEES